MLTVTLILALGGFWALLCWTVRRDGGRVSRTFAEYAAELRLRVAELERIIGTELRPSLERAITSIEDWHRAFTSGPEL